jgi:hypothetical protein
MKSYDPALTYPNSDGSGALSKQVLEMTLDQYSDMHDKRSDLNFNKTRKLVPFTMNELRIILNEHPEFFPDVAAVSDDVL